MREYSDEEQRRIELGRQALLLAAETTVDPRTAMKWLEGKRVLKSIAGLLADAAKKLEIERSAEQREAS
jgi:hypothetical protein